MGVDRQPRPRLGQKPMPRRSSQGKIRNIGSVGSTNQKTPVECAANRRAASSGCLRKSKCCEEL